MSPHACTIRRMVALQSSDDTESAHVAADELLCDLLSSLWYVELVAAYRRVPKWYA